MKKNKGFTLIEILIVVMIIAMIASLVAPKLFKKVEKSKREIAKTQIYLLENAIKMFKLDTGRYPTQQEGFKALFKKPEDTPNWDGPYLEKEVPKDPWGRDYVYKYSEEDNAFTIISYGADGKPGGEGENQDISNRSLKKQEE